MKLPKIPFLNPKKRVQARTKRRKPISVSPSSARIQREQDYMRRIQRPSSRLKRLQDRIDARGKINYGKE